MTVTGWRSNNGERGAAAPPAAGRSVPGSPLEDVIVLPGDSGRPDPRPFLLVDIDGVLNIFDAWIPVASGWTDGAASARRRMVAPPHLRVAQAAGYPLLLNPAHPEQFAALGQSFDIVWATMWMDQAWRFGQVAGFGTEWPYIDFDAHREVAQRSNLRIGAGVGSYKHPGIVGTLADRPGVWVDDDMSDGQIEWARRRTEQGIPTLFIRPDPAEGMTEEHVEQILHFAEAACTTAP